MASHENIASAALAASGVNDDILITMERYADMESPVPVYTLIVSGNGRVVYDGIRNVKIVGREIGQISKTNVNELVNEFINVYYFALKDKYDEPNMPGRPIVTTSISMDGKTKTVLHNHASRAAPEGLSVLEDKIDKITNSQQWTGMP
jgi:hypothetical protein